VRFDCCSLFCVQDYSKINEPISLKLGVYDCAYQSEELIKLFVVSGIRYPDHVSISLTIAE